MSWIIFASTDIDPLIVLAVTVVLPTRRGVFSEAVTLTIIEPVWLSGSPHRSSNVPGQGVKVMQK